MKKSLFLTWEYPPAHGGVATFYYQLCRHWPAADLVVLANQENDSAEFDKSQPYKIRREELMLKSKKPLGLDKLQKTVHWLSLIKKVKQAVEEEKIELLMVGQVLPLGSIALYLKKTKKLPFIFYAHGMDILVPQKFWRKKILLKKIIAQASGIVANSYFTKAELVKLGADPKKILVIQPGPNLELIDVPDDEVFEWKKEQRLADKQILLTVGRLVSRKGHDQVIKALPEILKAQPETVYLIAGQGPDEARLKQLVKKLKLEYAVRFLGAVNNRLLPTLYEACNVFIMPARQIGPDVEGFGIVYLEANMYGKPVIGGKSGGVWEAVINGQTGLLADPLKTEEIAKLAISLLSDKALAHKLGFQGQERVHDQFVWSRKSLQVVDFIDNNFYAKD